MFEIHSFTGRFKMGNGSFLAPRWIMIWPEQCG